MLRSYKSLIVILTAIFFIVSCNPKVLPEEKWSGTKWHLVLLGGKIWTARTDTQTPYLEFDTDKKTISGNGGCNSYGGNYELNDNRLTFTDIIHTEMACDALDTEVLFFEKLNDARTFNLKQDILQLMDDSNNVIIEMKKG